MTLRRSATDAAVWSVAQKWVYHGVRLVVFAVLVRELSPASFGLFALASIFVLLGELVVDQGFNDALVQRRTLGPAHLDAAFWAAVGGGVLLCGLFWVMAVPLALIFDEPELDSVLVALAPALVFASLSRTHEAVLRRRLAFRPIAVISLVAVTASGLVALAMAFAGLGVWALVGQQLTQRLLEVPCYWWVNAWRPRLRFSVPHFRSLLRFGANVIGINLLNFADRQADHLLIGYFLGTTALGFYTVATRLVRILLDLIPQTLMPVALSAFSRLQAEPQRLRAAFYETTRLMAVIAFPAFCGMGLVAPQMLPALFGEKWLPSVPVLQIMVAVGILHSLTCFFPTVLKAIGRPNRALWLASLSLVVNLSVLSVAVHWGVVAVAVAYVARGYLILPVMWIVLRSSIGVNLPQYLRSLVPAAGGTLFMALVLTFVQHQFFVGLDVRIAFAAAVLLGMAVYVLCVCSIAPGLCRHAREMVLRRTVVPEEARS